MSILSAVEDKVRRRLREDISQNQAEVDSLKKVQEELNRGNSRLTSIVSRVKTEDQELTHNISVLEAKRAEMTEIVAGVAGEIAEVVTGIMTETEEAEVGEAGIERAEDGGGVA